MKLLIIVINKNEMLCAKLSLIKICWCYIIKGHDYLINTGVSLTHISLRTAGMAVILMQPDIWSSNKPQCHVTSP